MQFLRSSMTPRSCVAAETMTRWDGHGQKFGDSCDIGTRNPGSRCRPRLFSPTLAPICYLLFAVCRRCLDASSSSAPLPPRWDLALREARMPTAQSVPYHTCAHLYEHEQPRAGPLDHPYQLQCAPHPALGPLCPHIHPILQRVPKN